MKKIVLIATGGTIASTLNPANGLYIAGAMSAEKLAAKCPVPGIDLVVENFSQEASSAITLENLSALAGRVEQVFTDAQTAGVVLTHGTDTLEETAYFLELVNADARPIIITGAQRTLFDQGSDALCNLRDAVLAAASPECRDLGAAIVFNEGIHAARYARKAHAFNVEAFAAFGYGRLGYVDKGQVCLVQRPTRRETYRLVRALPRVDIVGAYLGSDGVFIDAAVAAGAAGVIVQGFGRGHLPAPAAGAVSRAVERGVHVVVTSACEEGRVHPVYDFTGSLNDLAGRGAIPGLDYAPRKARVKLAVALAAGLDAPEQLREIFAR